MGFRIGDVIVDSIKYCVASDYIGDLRKDNSGFPDYQKMIKSGKYDLKDVAAFYVYDYLGIDPECVYVLLPYEDGDTQNLLCNILTVINAVEYKTNKRLLLNAFKSTVSQSMHLPNVLLKNEFYFESIVAFMMCDKMISPITLQPMVYHNEEFYDKLPEIFPKLSKQESEIVLELLNEKGMAKEAAMLLNACKNCESKVTDFDL